MHFPETSKGRVYTYLSWKLTLKKNLLFQTLDLSCAIYVHRATCPLLKHGLVWHIKWPFGQQTTRTKPKTHRLGRMVAPNSRAPNAQLDLHNSCGLSSQVKKLKSMIGGLGGGWMILHIQAVQQAFEKSEQILHLVLAVSTHVKK